MLQLLAETGAATRRLKPDTGAGERAGARPTRDRGPPTKGPAHEPGTVSRPQPSGIGYRPGTARFKVSPRPRGPPNDDDAMERSTSPGGAIGESRREAVTTLRRADSRASVQPRGRKPAREAGDGITTTHAGAEAPPAVYRHPQTGTERKATS